MNSDKQRTYYEIIEKIAIEFNLPPHVVEEIVFSALNKIKATIQNVNYYLDKYFDFYIKIPSFGVFYTSNKKRLILEVKQKIKQENETRIQSEI